MTHQSDVYEHQGWVNSRCKKWVSFRRKSTLYYDVFASLGGSQPSAPAKDLYDAFMAFVTAYDANRGR